MKSLKIILSSLTTLLYFFLIALSGCNFGTENNEYLYNRKITVETDLSELRISNLYLDSTATYPYILDETKTTDPGNGYYTIYPVENSGYILFKIFGAEGYGKLSLSLKDTLIIYSPIDTIGIFIQGFHFIK